VPAIGFGWYAAVTYVPMAKRMLAEDRHHP
jgi:hypothetical protein